MVRLKAEPTWEWLAPRVFLDRDVPSTAQGSVWRDLTAFVDATTGQELWEMYNHCSPCVGPGAH